jgi:branched-chain amino acid transport system ATP-binding protein
LGIDSDSILTVSGLRIGYGSILAVKEVSIRVGRKGIAAIIGANGAGKSTLIKGIMNLVRKEAGKIEYKGQDISSLPPYRIASKGIAYIPEGRQLFTKMSVKENLEMGVVSLGKQRALLAEGLERIYGMFPILRDRQQQLAGTLSGGEQQMLAMGRALISKPELCLFDEPSLGLAPLIQIEIFAVIEKLKGGDVSTLLVEQNAKKALEISDKCFVIELGTIVLEGDRDRVLKDPRVEKAYLGG